MENELLNALIEASKWENQMTEYEKTKITYFEAREAVINRIYKKYENILNNIKEIKK